MAIFVISTARTTSLIVDATDTVYVAPTGSIITTSGVAIGGRNVNSEPITVAIDSTVVSLADDAVRLPGTPASIAGHNVSIGQDGLVRSTVGDGFDMAGNQNRFRNDGEIHANGNGLVNEGTFLFFENSGLISSLGSGVVQNGGGADILNTGTILSRFSAISLGSGTGSTITNTGTLSGSGGIGVNGAANIVNAGDISGTNTGVSINGRGTVTNTGAIQGGNAGIYFEVNDVPGRIEVMNSGSVTGGTGVVFSSSVFGGVVDQQLTNTGTILGSGVGVTVGSSDATLINHGTIGGGESFAITAQAQVLIKNYGTLSGGAELNGLSVAVSLGIEADVVRNFGTITGSVLTGTGNDVVRNAGQIDREVDLGAGSDLYQGQRSTADATVYGGDQRDVILSGGGDDLLFGGSGDDVMRGGAGDDSIYGGSGRDSLSGNGGADLFIFGSADDASSGNKRDIIDGFKPGEDVIDLGSFMLGGSFIGEAAFGLVANQVRYTAATGRIEGDVNGDGVADWSLDLANRPVSLTGADFVF